MCIRGNQSSSNTTERVRERVKEKKTLSKRKQIFPVVSPLNYVSYTSADDLLLAYNVDKNHKENTSVCCLFVWI